MLHIILLLFRFLLLLLFDTFVSDYLFLCLYSTFSAGDITFLFLLSSPPSVRCSNILYIFRVSSFSCSFGGWSRVLGSRDATAHRANDETDTKQKT